MDNTQYCFLSHFFQAWWSNYDASGTPFLAEHMQSAAIYQYIYVFSRLSSNRQQLIDVVSEWLCWHQMSTSTCLNWPQKNRPLFLKSYVAIKIFVRMNSTTSSEYRSATVNRSAYSKRYINSWLCANYMLWCLLMLRELLSADRVEYIQRPTYGRLRFYRLSF